MLNVLIKLRAVPRNYLVNHSIKHKGNPPKLGNGIKGVRLIRMKKEGGEGGRERFM